MKETLNDKIELARQSGYNEACYIKDKKFRGFIQRTEKRLKEIKMHELIDRFGNFKCLEFEDIIEMVFKEEAGKELANHSPQGKGSSEMMKSLEETRKGCANCGKREDEHFDTDLGLYCPDALNNNDGKKFKPQKSCGVSKIIGRPCPACSGDGE